MRVMKPLLHVALIEKKKKSCSYPFPSLMFIKRHKDWKQGAVLHSSKICCLLETLRFCLTAKQKLEHKRNCARTQVNKIIVSVIPRSSSVFLMCFSLILLPFSLLLPVFNLWQLLRSHSRDFLDQKYLHACLKQMREENSDILQRAPEPCWTRIEGADCNWLYDTAVGVRQTGPCGQARRAPAAARRERQCQMNMQHSPEKLRWITAALRYDIRQRRDHHNGTVPRRGRKLL